MTVINTMLPEALVESCQVQQFSAGVGTLRAGFQPPFAGFVDPYVVDQ